MLGCSEAEEGQRTPSRSLGAGQKLGKNPSRIAATAEFLIEYLEGALMIAGTS
jgi:hypothetical protein